MSNVDCGVCRPIFGGSMPALRTLRLTVLCRARSARRPRIPIHGAGSFCWLPAGSDALGAISTILSLVLPDASTPYAATLVRGTSTARPSLHTGTNPSRQGGSLPAPLRSHTLHCLVTFYIIRREPVHAMPRAYLPAASFTGRWSALRSPACQAQCPASR